MPSILAALGFLILLSLVIAKRPFLGLLYFFVFFSITWRLVSAVYIDVAGPVYSIQLFRGIGPGRSAVVLAIACSLSVLGLLLPFRNSRLANLSRIAASTDRRLESGRASRLLTVLAGMFLIYVVLLYIDFVQIGVYPLVTGIERWAYTEQNAGPFHQLLMSHGNLIAFGLGVLHYYRMRRGTDRLSLLLLIALYGYLLLTGHRFSFFYSFTSFFCIPLAFQHLLTRKDREPSLQLSRVPLAGTAPRIRKLWGLGLALCLLIPAGLYQSLTVARRYDSEGAWESFHHRTLVQQGELWWVSHERVIESGKLDQDWCFHRVFVEPMDAKRNSTLPYLMELHVGNEAPRLTQKKSSYAGGFPEIFFELFGPLFAFPMIFAFSFVTGELTYALGTMIAEERYAAVLFTFLVLYAFLLTHNSGMLNFLVNWKFWLKAALMGGTVLYAYGQRGRPRTDPEDSSAPCQDPLPPPSL